MADIDDPYLAWCFDHAVGTWGTWVESELSKVKGKTAKIIKKRQEGKLEALLSGKKARQFADPAAMFKRK